MNNKRFAIIAGLGCFITLIISLIAVLFVLPLPFLQFGQVSVTESPQLSQATLPPGEVATQRAIPTLTMSDSPSTEEISTAGPDSGLLVELYRQLSSGVVSVQVLRDQVFGAQGAGSGFLLDNQGHILTNNHVVSNARWLTVLFHNGFEAEAEIVGADDDSDLAVIKVEQIPESAQPLSLGDSDQVEVGEWVIAIGNPFGLDSSMSIGIVSAVGRSIPSVTPFNIPQAIQTDAAVNPGNSGGPLLNLQGEVIGVNAQIATSGVARANSGVGFAIPVNIVRKLAPVLIEKGVYNWPWLGIRGGSVNIALAQVNDLDSQQGAYVHEVISGGPADEAGLQGSTGTVDFQGISVFRGGDVILEVNGDPLADYNELLVRIASSSPGDELDLTILRDGDRQQVTVELAARPQNFEEE